MWNELTFLWNELTILWNDLTIDWNDLTWNDLTMERNDRKSRLLLRAGKLNREGDGNRQAGGARART